MSKVSQPKWITAVAFALLFCASLFAGTISGKIQQPSSTIPLKSGTLTFTLSQAAYVPGGAALATDPLYCYTTVDGSIAGLPDPLALPTAQTKPGGSLAGQTVYVEITYFASGVETLVSPELKFTVNAIIGGTLQVQAPVLQPVGATGYNVYVSTSSGTETLQVSTTGWGATNISSLVAGAAPPSSNNSTCSIRFNDEMVPYYTSYRVGVTNSAGAAVSGFPQRWRLFGGAAGNVNVSNGYPTATGDVVFPTPILASPTGNVQQSINGPLTLNGYTLTAGVLKSTVATGTQPVQVTSTTPVDNLFIKNLNSTLSTNNPNVDTVIFDNPAAIQTIHFPDSGTTPVNILYDKSATIDCTLAAVVCTLTTKVYFEGAGCNGSTGALGWDTFSTNAPVSGCITGSNTQKGVMKFKAAVNLEQQAANNLNPASAGTITLTPLTTTANDLLIAVVAVLGNQTISACNDGSAYTLAKRSQNGASLDVEIWYRPNASALSGATLTCTATGASVMGLQFYEYSGAAVAPLDQTQNGSGTGTSIASTATGTTGQATELIFSAAATANGAPTVTGGSGFNVHTTSTNTQSTGINAVSEGSIANATGTFTGPLSIGSSQVWASAIATFKSTTSPGPVQSAQRGYLLPADFVAPLNVNLLWYDPTFVTTSGTVQLGVATGCIASLAADDNAFNTVSSVTANVPTAINNALTITPISAVTISGCAAGNLMHIQIQRLAGNANDNYEQPVQLYGLEATYSRAQ